VVSISVWALVSPLTRICPRELTVYPCAEAKPLGTVKVPVWVVVGLEVLHRVTPGPRLGASYERIRGRDPPSFRSAAGEEPSGIVKAQLRPLQSSSAPVHTFTIADASTLAPPPASGWGSRCPADSPRRCTEH
jgi:hypothetical protein